MRYLSILQTGDMIEIGEKVRGRGKGGELDLTILPAGDMTEIGEKVREVEGGWSMTSPCCRLVT